MFALLLGLFAGLCWSAHDLIARYLSSKIGAYRMAVWTLLLGSTLLSCVVLWHGTIQYIDLKTAELILVLGIAYGVAVGSLFKAFSIAPVSIVGPFTAGYPALVVVWGIVIGVEPNAIQLFAVVLIFGGAVIVGRMGSADGGLATVVVGERPALLFFCALACLCFAAAVILGQMASSKLGEIETTFLNRIPAALILLPFALREKPLIKTVNLNIGGALIAMAMLDVVAVCCINFMGRFPHKELGAMGISAYGAISVLLAMMILKERVTAWQWFGIAMIVSGVGVLTISS